MISFEEEVMRHFLEPSEIGVFQPADVEVLRSAFVELRRRDKAMEEETRAQAVARSLIKLYRHGLQDSASLIATLDRS
jgi:hypothetical protein